MAIVNTHVEAVQKLYVAYFNRPADHAGLDYWTNVVEAQKGSTTAVSAAFAAEAEYKTAYAGMTNAQVVNQVYLNLFGRAAETAGQTYWADLLTSGKITIDKVVAEIAKGAQTTDAESYENKVSGATAFTAQLDTKAEQDGYRGAAANTAAKAFITSITTDASLTVAVAPAALATTVGNVVAAGTPFTVVGALQSLEVAADAKAAFLVTADGDGKATTSTTDAKLATAVTTTEAAVVKLLGTIEAGDAVETTYTTGSAAVKAALIADQIAANTKALTDAQAAVATKAADVAKIAGLQSAISTAAAAKTADANATKAQGVAAADLAAKLAFYNASNTTQVTVAVDGTVTIPGVAEQPGPPVVPAVPAKPLIALNEAGTALVLATGVTETTNPGITALLASSTALEAAQVAATKATAAAVATQNTVDYIDTSAAEKIDLEAIRAKMTTVAEGNVPTEAQIAEQLAIYKATDNAKYLELKGLVDAFYDQTAIENPLTKALADAEAAASTAAKNIENFTKAQAALVKAQALVAEGKALDATVAAATKVFGDNGYAINNVVDATEFGSSKSDIFIAGEANSSIELFNLQGVDSLFIGSDYTLVKGALTTGNDAVLEAFVTSLNGNTVISLETSKFGSSAADAEVVVITLVGVDATTIQLNNGIITSVAPTV
ncbi:DUF4214 domain-containing protein [Telluria aromaticivorans]|uniref:DUF4214 domain-containing protein n=1 Tax=Telluria aromaticivorans TaxID=2725995 RepID=A0A7Y2NZA3_9BURK|nr:DUF4214 domain-containing protein [Telluria aromaticivorans]NNG22933.1 DUF4214 domain-containing protein [Telluria aromaticivorans]